MRYDTIRCKTMQCNTIQYNTLKYDIIQYNTMRYNTIQYNIMRYDTIRYDTMRCNAMQCNTLQYNITPCNVLYLGHCGWSYYCSHLLYHNFCLVFCIFLNSPEESRIAESSKYRGRYRRQGRNCGKEDENSNNIIQQYIMQYRKVKYVTLHYSALHRITINTIRHLNP